MPDLVQSFAVACCMRRIPFLFRGVETLRIKETDRIQALIEELGKLGYLLKAEGDGALIWEGERTGGQPCPRIATYHDHRMAMAWDEIRIFGLLRSFSFEKLFHYFTAFPG